MVSEGEASLAAEGNAVLLVVGSDSFSALDFTRDGVKNAELDVVGTVGGTALGSSLRTNSLYSRNAKSLHKVSSQTMMEK